MLLGRERPRAVSMVLAQCAPSERWRARGERDYCMSKV
jgi:hypothetical protein